MRLIERRDGGRGDEAEISITLNTQITNETDKDGDIVMGLTYTDGTDTAGDPALGNPADYTGEGKEVLSDGGTTITWTIPTDPVEPGGIMFPDDANGLTVTINGILADDTTLWKTNDLRTQGASRSGEALEVQTGPPKPLTGR